MQSVADDGKGKEDKKNCVVYKENEGEIFSSEMLEIK